MLESLRHSPNIRLLIILLITPISGITVDLYVPSLPAIAHYFSCTPHLSQITVSSYLLGYGIFQFFAGPITDSIGRRQMLLWGLVAFCIITWLLTYSPNIETFIAARFAQGITMALGPGTIVRALLSDSFTGKKLKVAANYCTTVWALGPILAPALGGYLQVHFGWRANFIALLVYGVCLLILCCIFLPETNLHQHPFKIREKANDIKIMLTDSIFVALLVVMILGYGYLLIFNVLGPFLIEHTLGFSALVYGRMAMILGLGWLTGSISNRLLSIKLETKTCVFIGIIWLCIATLILWVTAITMPLTLWTIIIPCIILFAGACICFTNTFGFILSRFPKRAGTAGSLYGCTMFLGNALITYIAGFTHLNTQIPMFIIYSGYTIILSYCLFYAVTRITNKQAH